MHSIFFNNKINNVPISYIKQSKILKCYCEVYNVKPKNMRGLYFKVSLSSGHRYLLTQVKRTKERFSNLLSNQIYATIYGRDVFLTCIKGHVKEKRKKSY